VSVSLRLPSLVRAWKDRIVYICIICDNSNRGICVHDQQPIAIDKGSSVHGFIYRRGSGVTLWQSALPLIRCRLGFYLSFIFLYCSYMLTVWKRNIECGEGGWSEKRAWGRGAEPLVKYMKQFILMLSSWTNWCSVPYGNLKC